MDKLNKKWIGEPNFYFKRKREVIEKLITGSCLNVGCGSHKIKGAKNVDLPEFDATKLKYWRKIGETKGFDTIILSDILEHLNETDFLSVMTYAKTYFNKRIIITVPAYTWLWSKYDELLGHKRRYNEFSINLDKGIQKTFYLFGALLPLYFIRKFTSGKTPKLPKWLDWIFYQLSKINLPFGPTMVIVYDLVNNSIELPIDKKPVYEQLGLKLLGWPKLKYRGKK